MERDLWINYAATILGENWATILCVRHEHIAMQLPYFSFLAHHWQLTVEHLLVMFPMSNPATEEIRALR